MSMATLDPETMRRWKQYPSYRDVRLDWSLSIPAHWRHERLKTVASVRPSNVDKKSVESENEVRLCNYVDVYKNDRITADMEFMAATATDAQIQQFSIHCGDVIVTKDSETWDDIAVPAHVPETIDGLVCGYHLALIRPDARHLEGAYLARCFAAEGLCDQFRIAANGITRYGLDTQSIKCAVFPVPPLPEQRAIATFLDRETARIDALIERKELLIELLEEKRQAAISHTVTKGLDSTVPMKDSGIEWLGQIPAHWEVKRLKHVCKLETGHTPRKSENRFWLPEDCNIPWISLNDTKSLESADFIDDTNVRISQVGMNNSAAHLIEAGAVVFNRDGARVGLSAITTKQMCLSQHMIGWVCGPTLYNHYLLHVIYAMEQEIYRLTTGATIPTIGMPDVKRMVTPLPPLEEQKSITSYLVQERARLTQLIQHIGNHIGLLCEYRSALVSAAVTGQIDIRHEVEA